MIDTAPLPATAQGDTLTFASCLLSITDDRLVANQKAKYLVKKLNKIGKDEESPKPFEFHNQGSMAYIGDWYKIFLSFDQPISLADRKAIYDRPGEGDGFMTKESGRVAWLLWRSAYFTMTLSWRNKFAFLLCLKLTFTDIALQNPCSDILVSLGTLYSPA